MNRRHVKMFMSIVSLWIVWSRAMPAVAQPVLFAQLSVTSGITTDVDGNVFIHSDNLSNTLLTKFAPGRRPLAQVGLGEFNPTECVGSCLITDTVRDVILLPPQGWILAFDPRTLQGQDLIDLRPFVGQTDLDVDDILRQKFHPFQLLSPVYGDIAIGQSDANPPALLVVGLVPIDGIVTAQLREV